MYELLFSPCAIGTLTIPNRIVMEPMQNYLAREDGKCSDRDVAFLTARAKGGVGLIQTGTICVDLETGRPNRHVLALDRDSQIDSFRAMTEAVHRQGTCIFAELFHPGRQGNCGLNGGRPLLAPSETVCSFSNQPARSMTEEECGWMADKFVSAAQRAKEAGFDGVTLHCAHGYLLGEFLSPYTNLRGDAYGGSPQGRAKLVVDILRGIRARCGSLPIAIRLSADEFLDRIGLPRQRGVTVELAGEYARMFAAAGADAIDVSAGIYETMNTAWEPSGFRQGWKTHLAQSVREQVSVPVICTSVIRDPAFAEQLLSDGVCDFVGSARAFLAEPQWANRARQGREKDIRPCLSCLHCFDTLLRADETGEPPRCAVNPEACRESDFSDPRANGRGRCVAIVGGGPAGMEAARVLALRRFQPVVLERSGRLGGQLNLAGIPPTKERFCALVDYYRRQLELLRVEVRLNTEATPALLRALKPDAVVIASGAVENRPDFPIDSGARVYSVEAALTGRADWSGIRVAVIGAGPTGMETADFLAGQSAQVVLCDQNDAGADTMYFQNYMDLLSRLEGKGVLRRNNCRVTEVRREGCELSTSCGRDFLPCDAVVLALGNHPNQSLTGDVRGFCDQVLVVGDAAWGRNCAAAVQGAHDAAYRLLETSAVCWN